MSYNKLRSKLNRAIVAYLVNAGAGSAGNVSPANSSTSLGYPNTTIISTLSRPEVPLTGLRRITVHVSIKGSDSRDATNETDSTAEARRAAFDSRVGDTYDALMQSDDDQSLNATAELITAAGRALAVSDPTNNGDMSEFTCQAWFDAGEGDGEADAEGCSWEEVLMFEALVSGDNVD